MDRRVVKVKSNPLKHTYEIRSATGYMQISDSTIILVSKSTGRTFSMVRE